VEGGRERGGLCGFVLIHSPNSGPEARKNLWTALEKAKEAGKVRDIGVSNYGRQHIEEMKSFAKVWPPVVNQIEVRRAPHHIDHTDQLMCRSYTHGANSVKQSSTANPKASLSKRTVRWCATRRRMIRR
jgi:predicted oxidoreductase